MLYPLITLQLWARKVKHTGCARFCTIEASEIAQKKMKTFKQAALIVLDGWGHREDSKDNAIAAAKKPFFDSIWKQYPHTLLQASGLDVGLPDGQMGNSEIGHTTIGAGTVIDTDLVRVK